MQIAVVGSGVVGLTTAVRLLKEGRDVVVYSSDPEQRLTAETVSVVACALWQPYKLYTDLSRFDAKSFDAVKRISMDSLREFGRIADEHGSERTGIYDRRHYEYSVESIKEPRSGDLKRDFYYIDVLREYWSNRGDGSAILDEYKIDERVPFKARDKNDSLRPFQYVHGYRTFVIDPPVFLSHLRSEVIRLGGEIKTRRLNLNEIKKLKEKVIFNCTGINGFALTNSKASTVSGGRTIVPQRGVLLLYDTPTSKPFSNSIVLDELTILSRSRQLTIGTGVIQDGEDPAVLIGRLKEHAVQFAEATGVERYGFDRFVKANSLDLRNPTAVLIGARPYFSDGRGYVMSRYDHRSGSKVLFTMYNNFGHGGSGVTLCCGCARESVALYQSSVQRKLLSLNRSRERKWVADFNIEFAHFDLRNIKEMKPKELDALIAVEDERLKGVCARLGIARDRFSLLVLIDDKEAGKDEQTLRRLVTALRNVGVDFVAYESRLESYVDGLRKKLPNSIAKEFSRYMQSHFRLGCAHDIFVWYCLRFGIVNFDLEDDVIVPLSRGAKDGETPFVANSLITLLDKGVRTYEERADEYLTRSFGFEIATSVRRFYF